MTGSSEAKALGLAALRIPPAAAWLPAALLALVALAYLPSLGGGWVWDDHYQLEANPNLLDPRVILTTDTWGSFGQPHSHLYRPLHSLSYIPGQWLWPGPRTARLESLLFHLGVVVLVARVAIVAGASRDVAWFAAGLFGVHPATSEAVAWVSVRHDPLGALLLLGAWASLLRRRDRTAGLLLALAPFAKEPLLLAPLTACIWMLAARRFSPWTLGLGAAGGAAYLLARKLAGVPFPEGATHMDAPLGAIGAVTGRGIELALAPGAADAVPPFEPSALLGALALAFAVGAAWAFGRAIRRREPAAMPLAALLASLPVLVAAVPASAKTGIVADRYFYATFAGLAVALALALSSAWERWPPLRGLWLLLPALMLATWDRAGDWVDDDTLFRASLRRDPANARAEFHLAYDLHARRGDCRAAVPRYRRAQAVERRAGNSLQACLVALGELDEAAAIGPSLAQADPENPTPALNTARALARLGRLPEAERWARDAVERSPERAASWVLLGQIMGQREHYPAARSAFERALALDPRAPGALSGAAAARSFPEGNR